MSDLVLLLNAWENDYDYDDDDDDDVVVMVFGS